MQAPKATINNPMPISAFADQWQIGRLLNAGPQQLFFAGSAQQSASALADDALSVDAMLGSQTLNKNLGPSAISRPSTITIAALIIIFFMFCYSQKDNPAFFDSFCTGLPGIHPMQLTARTAITTISTTTTHLDPDAFGRTIPILDVNIFKFTIMWTA